MSECLSQINIQPIPVRNNSNISVGNIYSIILFTRPERPDNYISNNNSC